MQTNAAKSGLAPVKAFLEPLMPAMLRKYRKLANQEDIVDMPKIMDVLYANPEFVRVCTAAGRSDMLPCRVRETDAKQETDRVPRGRLKSQLKRWFTTGAA